MESKSLAVVALLLFLTACYGDPRLPEPSEPTVDEVEATAEPTPEVERQGGPAVVDPGVQAQRVEAVTGVLDRLGSQGDEVPAEQRDGAASWRASELEKLLELTEACCSAGGAPCRQCLGVVADRDLPADELWTLMGRFLGELRPRAEDGAEVLGVSLLLRDDGLTRDRAFRVAVGSGAATRGEPDEEGRRATTIPARPEEGERVVVVYEQPAWCPVGRVDLKGPTPAGRYDLDFVSDCPEPPPQPDDLTILRASRAVWAFDAGPLPASGFSLWMGGDRPLLEVKPPPAGPVAKP